jgi:tRNA threonylcarbamoyladenosine biosynthesis protein TsaB
MALILCIETATEVCSVALCRDGLPVVFTESSEKNVHSAKLTLFIAQVSRDAGITLHDLDAVAVSKGPGSYTGLRIGVAAAKGLCYALDKPLVAVSTLQAMAMGILPSPPTPPPAPPQRREGRMTPPLAPPQKREGWLVCPMIDARRMEVYCALYDSEGREAREVRAEIIDEHSFEDVLARHSVLFGGDGAAKCREALGIHPNATFAEGFRTSARFMAGLAEKTFARGEFENLAYFEPFYLKDFVAGKPRVKGLH